MLSVYTIISAIDYDRSRFRCFFFNLVALYFGWGYGLNRAVMACSILRNGTERNGTKIGMNLPKGVTHWLINNKYCFNRAG